MSVTKFYITIFILVIIIVLRMWNIIFIVYFVEIVFKRFYDHEEHVTITLHNFSEKCNV